MSTKSINSIEPVTPVVPTNENSATPLEQFIVFKVDDSEYVVHIASVLEVIRIRPIKKLPITPSYILGVLNLRGNIIPVINLRDKFGLTLVEYNPFTRIVVLNHSGRFFGLVVDEVNKSISVKKSDYTESPSLLENKKSQEFVRFIIKQREDIYLLLELDSLLFALTSKE